MNLKVYIDIIMKPHVLPMLDYFNIEQRNKAQISTNDTVTLSIMVNNEPCY